MSRIGRLPITVPAGVKVDINGSEVTVKGPKGEMKRLFSPIITIEQEGNEITVKRSSDEASVRALHGTTRALLHNMIVGVSEGFQKTLIIKGVGYKAVKRGDVVMLYVGYSLVKGKGDEMVPQEKYCIKAPEGIKLEVLEQAADPTIVVKGADKQAVGQVAAVIRSKRPPEPYHGKGIQYQGERIRRKAGKTGK